MFTVTVRDHVMIAHSLHGEAFGPAQRLHGATYVVDATFCAESLDENGIVLDIGQAADVVKAVLAELNYRNLDDEPAFAGRNTTTEVLAEVITDRIVDRLDVLGDAQNLAKVVVALHESHIASASYERTL